MEDLLRSRALWRITLETQVAPLYVLKEDNWENKRMNLMDSLACPFIQI